MTYVIVQEVAYAICKKAIENLDDKKLVDEQVKLIFLDMESLFTTPFGKDILIYSFVILFVPTFVESGISNTTTPFASS